MAIMIPESISSLNNVTSGEKKVFKILKELLPQNYICWFDLRVSNRYPDFIILAPDLGIIVLEVKDWEEASIKEADLNRFQLKTLGSCTNPLKQARDYMFNIINELKKDKNLIESDGKYKGRLKFTYGHGVIFTKITKKSFRELGLEGTIEQDFVIFEDELNDIERNKNNAVLKSRLENMIPIKFKFNNLNEISIDRIRASLFKEVKIYQNDNEVFKVMNLEQEKYAKGLGYGHRVIRGVAGSGKTIVLICRAKYLKEVHKDWNILVICYNKVLASFLRKTINNGDKESNVEIIHLHGWINKISKQFNIETAVFDSKVTENISKITESMLQNLKKYDAILIDEGQDLELEWLKFIVKNLRNPEHSHLLLASDGAQNLYNRKYTLKSVGIKAVGRTTIMRENYRNTKEILKIGNDLLLEDGIKHSNEDENEFIIEANSVLRSGQTPTIIEAISFDEEVKIIIDKIKTLKSQGVEYGDIAILYPYSKYKGIQYAKIIKEKLEEAYINYDILKNDYDKYNKDRVKVSTIYSAKGLDFKVVFICAINDGLMRKKNESKKTLYVGITRAREILNITCSVKNQLTEIMLKSYEESKNNEDMSNKMKKVDIKTIQGEETEKINLKDVQIKDSECKKKKGFLQKLLQVFK